MDAVKTVGVIAKPDAEAARKLVPALVEWLEERGVVVRLDEATCRHLSGRTPVPREQVPDGCQLVVVLGGDGTLLSAARAIGGREIPLFAVNLGSLGFLTAITVDEVFPELERAFRGEHRVARRRLLKCEVTRRGSVISAYEALNDVVITTASLARMIEAEAFIDSQFVCRYKADGVIVATPTGSTAYSLSAGGPIVFPSVAALCLTPICPHTLTHRPVLVADTSLIRLVNRAVDRHAYLTVDGQVGEPLNEGDEVSCRMSEKALRLIRPPRAMFFDVLRAKLKWGER
jgi:NAD+ kinase